jgi:hypothetical protein
MVLKGRNEIAGLPCLRHFIANLSIDPVTHVTGYYLSWLRHLGGVGLEAPTYARGLCRPPPCLNPPRRAEAGINGTGRILGMIVLV